MKSSAISFQSKIKFVDTFTFNKLPLSSSSYIDEPWSEKEIIKTKQGYTDRVQTCSAGGITNGSDVVMFHLNDKEFSKNDNFEKAKVALKEQMDKSSNALIVGGKHHKRKVGDYNLYNKNYNNLMTSGFLKDNLVNFFNSMKTSFSMFWGQPLNYTKSQVFYSNENGEDTWFINNTKPINNVDDLKNVYHEIHISDKDKQDGVYINGERLSDAEIDELNS